MFVENLIGGNPNHKILQRRGKRHTANLIASERIMASGDLPGKYLDVTVILRNL